MTARSSRQGFSDRPLTFVPWATPPTLQGVQSCTTLPSMPYLRAQRRTAYVGCAADDPSSDLVSRLPRVGRFPDQRQHVFAQRDELRT
jgi:hypothetical protein